MIAAVILAAGTSSRMGRPKLLLGLGGKSLVRRAAEAATRSAAKQVVVVAGAYRDEIERELRGLPIQVTHNPDFKDGMSTSLRKGISVLRPEVEAAVVLLADQPLVDNHLVDALIDLRSATGATIVQPRYAGQPGNPVLWDRRFFPELMRQVGDQGGRQVLREHADEIVYREIPDGMAGADVDTPEAYQALREAAGEAAATHAHPDTDARYCRRCGGGLEPRDVGGRTRLACSRCGAIAWSDPKVAVAVIIPMGDGILLGKRSIDPGYGKWSFPAGYVDRGEVVEEAAVREVREELNVGVQLDGLVGVYSAHGRAVILIVYAGHIAKGEPLAAAEVSEVAAFDPKTLPEMAFELDELIVRDWSAMRARGWLP